MLSIFSSFWLAVILGENQVMIYPYEHLLIPCLFHAYVMDQIHWICPGIWYTLFQLLVWNIWLMQTWGFCTQPFTSNLWLIFSGHHDSWWLSWLCWFLFLVMNWMNCACSCFTLTWWFANVVDWHGSRVCVLFIWPLLHPWPWHTGSFTLWLILCLALLLLA
jgi:hypothetical protein